ncbi:hypothetical protein MNBD_GAMMA26-2259 [hydrothermal vent metagenome]|uniref:PilZ domain-containing protein n=1 Tax=hydrothermal vent metagenome TaxID=652676 RepID=A0A3B1BWN0_9ZZZZ
MFIKNRLESANHADEANGRRAIRRRHLIYYLRVWDMANNEVLGHIVDITTEGIMLISDQQIELNKEYDLEIRWNDAEGDAKTIRFKAESCWSHLDINTSFHDTGFHLIEATPEVLDPIHELIDEYGFND